MAINTWSAGNGYQTVHEHAPRLSPPLPPPPPANAILMSGSPAAPPASRVPASPLPSTTSVASVTGPAHSAIIASSPSIQMAQHWLWTSVTGVETL
ncbi:hypothetical protein H2203_000216 [Taxawa tesnikishii (nom. ined.)]|nr:hypothetical protein H2203_000216 [Dothideales sp. JES 119]